jgi:hypothetical protein
VSPDSAQRLNNKIPLPTASKAVDTKLDQLNTRIEKDTTLAGAQIIVSQIQGMSKELTTADQRVYAAVIEALANGIIDPSNGKACETLRKVEREAAGTKHAGDFNTMFGTCKPE